MNSDHQLSIARSARCVLLLLTASVAAATAADSPAGIEFFERKVRPVLAESCYECHGPEKQKGKLRLDSAGAIRAGGEAGPVFVPGKPAESRLITGISYGDPEFKMPPKKKLSAQQIADLTEWVRMGAPLPAGEAVPAPVAKKEFEITAKDRSHWAFQPLKRPEVPKVSGKEGTTLKPEPSPRPLITNSLITNYSSLHPIDAFIRTRLAAKKLAPNPPASRAEWLRRATYDLTGLPPSTDEMAAFLADPSPRAFETVIDRLLQSPRYGEKWGRHWLDLVRFAESNSYERDNPKPHAWRYRDYVIQSFNADKPYDRFLREQLAGDELPDANADSIIATGFYRLGIWDDEPADRELARFDGLDDIVATTGQVFLGLTIDCARCHNHKIDPISQRDYYRLLAFFHNVTHYRNGGPTDEVPLFTTAAQKQAAEKRARELEQRRNELQAGITEIEKNFRTLYAKGEAKTAAAAQSDLDDLQFRYYRDTWDKLPDFTLIKAETTGTVPSRLFDIGLRTRDTAFGFVFEGQLIVPKAGDYTFFLDSDDGSRLTVGGKEIILYDGIHGEGAERKATVPLRQGRIPIKLEYFQRQNGWGLTVAWSGPDFPRRSLSTTGETGGDPKQRLAKKDFNRLIRDEGARVLGKQEFARYEKLKGELDGLKQDKPLSNVALAVTETGRQAPDTFLLARGNPALKGEKVTPGFLQVLGATEPQIPELPPGIKSTGRRTALANWITSPANPLTARVMVNRIWQHHFGRGIVRSPSNFGYQGDKPTHPELLDWLASDFVANGWRLKSLHKTIMLSDVYRMSSRGRPEALAADPANDLFWRFDQRRLTAEEIRDSILAITGVLNLKMFGPGIYVDIPREVLAGQSRPGANWGKSTPEEQARRSIYIHVKRSLLTPILDSFDIAETDRSAPVRFVSVQPTQALGMLNGDFLNQQAEVFAARLQREAPGDVAQQVRRGLHLATTRIPTDAEVKRGLALIETLRTADNATPEIALKYFCLMALNLNELVYLD